ncbi:hypothetical protein B296_00004262 [Ensete ventricosum]|uniref:Uncharacterized protein n=1 Tax=Ensete ventricosum TaxID=4639 RepID=A0A426ZT69_ENSVE|nr:hypothetical protein B296_00004262 [Ensete ventricosum]
MPKMSNGKTPSTRAVAPAWEVGDSPAREAPKTSSKRPIDAPIGQVDDPTRRHKKVNVLTRGHKFRHDEGEFRSHSKDKKPAAPSEGVREGTSPPSAGARAIHAPLGGLVGSSCQGNAFGKSQLQQELDTLKSGGCPEAVAKVEECASELGQELEKTKRERRLEASEKDLSEVRGNLAEVQQLLKEARVRARKMDDELLQVVKALENARTELPKQAIVQYKESAGFKEGLKRMG